MAKPNFNGQWIIDHTDGNTDEFLTTTGTGITTSQLPIDITEKGCSKLEIKQDGDSFEIKRQFKTDSREYLMKFTAGDSYEYTRRSTGQKIKVNTKWDGESLVSSYETDIPIKSIMTLEGNKLVKEYICKEAVVKHIYTKE